MCNRIFHAISMYSHAMHSQNGKFWTSDQIWVSMQLEGLLTTCMAPWYNTVQYSTYLR